MDPRVCDTLSSREGFADYITRLRNATNNDFSLISNCTLNVCGALWGTGNPDISGVGMAIGYLLETVIGAIIIAVSSWCHLAKSNRTPASYLLISSASKSYFDTSAFFTFAIQLACIVTLSRADWGFSAEGMGGTTKEITWLVSSITLLPLLPFMLRPNLFMAKPGNHPTEPLSALSGPDTRSPSDKLAESRQHYRLLAVVICWALAFGPFYSRMGNTFGESMVGDSKNAVITTVEWSKIEQTCLANIDVLDPARRNLITEFGMMSYFLTSLVVVLKIYVSATQGSPNNRWRKLNSLDAIFNENSMRGLIAWLSACNILAFLLVIQFWAFFRLREIQSDMVTAARGSSPDGQWSFGQIVAIVVFMPVLVEVLFVRHKMLLYIASPYWN